MRCGKSRAGGWQWWSERWLSRAKRGGEELCPIGRMMGIRLGWGEVLARTMRRSFVWW